MLAPAHLKAAVSPSYKQAARRAFLRCSAVANVGSRVMCPCCGQRLRHFARFHGANDQCTRCGSLMRQRALFLYLRDELRVGSSRRIRVLHFAPERALQAPLRSLKGVIYLSADLASPLADVEADITALPFDDEAFDLILCSHVLEHVPDDSAALAELFRVIARGGTAVIQVPPHGVTETFEDASVRSPLERERVFGQYDHVRLCGPDYQRRIEDAGFAVKVLDPVERVDRSRRERLGLRPGEPFYVSTKVRP